MNLKDKSIALIVCGLAWFLRFLVSWLKVFGVEISNEFFEKLLLSFPGSLCLVRQFLNLDRDNFN